MPVFRKQPAPGATGPAAAAGPAAVRWARQTRWVRIALPLIGVGGVIVIEQGHVVAGVILIAAALAGEIGWVYFIRRLLRRG